MIDDSEDVDTGTVIETTDLGPGGAISVAVDPTTEDGYVWAYGSISDIDESDDAAHGTIVIDHSPTPASDVTTELRGPIREM